MIDIMNSVKREILASTIFAFSSIQKICDNSFCISIAVDRTRKYLLVQFFWLAKIYRKNKMNGRRSCWTVTLIPLLYSHCVFWWLYCDISTHMVKSKKELTGESTSCRDLRLLLLPPVMHTDCDWSSAISNSSVSSVAVTQRIGYMVRDWQQTRCGEKRKGRNNRRERRKGRREWEGEL